MERGLCPFERVNNTYTLLRANARAHTHTRAHTRSHRERIYRTWHTYIFCSRTDCLFCPSLAHQNIFDVFFSSLVWFCSSVCFAIIDAGVSTRSFFYYYFFSFLSLSLLLSCARARCYSLSVCVIRWRNISFTEKCSIVRYLYIIVGCLCVLRAIATMCLLATAGTPATDQGVSVHAWIRNMMLDAQSAIQRMHTDSISSSRQTHMRVS